MSAPIKTLACSGCQALVPDIDGPSHPNLGASPGCWVIYGECWQKHTASIAIPPCIA
ncbi:hypothetical protein HUU39_19040 [candidate division KSB1 bacterium]|nr:hypothetical protein [bacterium]NUM67339.1 hypothetical protein [candidate division KSB1 bacterium]